MYCKLVSQGFEGVVLKGINSSKVYCKLKILEQSILNNWRINSSKVYCKFQYPKNFRLFHYVLIVAKCIVN